MKKKTLWIWLIVMLASACRNGDIYNSDLIRNRGAWFEPLPYGMVYIQRGSFQLGPSDDEIIDDTKMRSITVEAFWMDDTEITNNEYRQFVYWVRDSIARRLLGESDPEYLITETN